MKMTVLIIDDEASARSRLRKLMEGFGTIRIVGEAADCLEAVSEIVRLRPDLIFLDVQMPGLNGFEVLASLPKDAPRPLVIFSTAYDEFALAAFEENALAYLLKPVNRERLVVALDRAIRIRGDSTESEQEARRIAAVNAALATPLKQVVVRKRDRYFLLPIEEIIFLRVEDSVVKVKTKDGLFRMDGQLGDIGERLPEADFFRAHRSAIVNLKKVAEIVPHFKGTFVLVLKDDSPTEIQVSERQSKRLRELLNL